MTDKLCPYLKSCQSAMAQGQGAASHRFPKLFQLQFCQNCYHACARYFIIKQRGITAVPHDLLPVDLERAAHCLK